MGCDIHTHVEVMRGGAGTWFCADYWKKNPYHDPDHPDEDEREYSVVEVWTGRHYELFGILAGVRCHPECGTICEPKGIPADTCKEIREGYERWGCDAHTPSWFTLKELMSFRSHNENASALDPLIKALKVRAESELWIFDDEDLENRGDEIRVVFWFDN